MHINNANLSSTGAGDVGRSQRSEAAGLSGSQGGRGAGRADSDRVQVSDFSARLLKAAAADSPDRAARIDRLAQEFRSGQYKVDALAVSRGLIQEGLAGLS